MKKIVREYQEVCTEYLVEADSDEEAIKLVSKNEGIEIDIVPVFVSVLKREVRSITSKDERDPVFQQALQEFEYKDELEIVQPKKSFENETIEELMEMCRG